MAAMRPLSIVLFALFAWGFCFAQEAASPVADSPDPTEYITKFFASVAKENSDEAFNTLFKGNPWMEGRSDALAHVKAQYLAMASQLGKFCGYQSVLTKDITDRLVYTKVLVYYERQPIELTFIFFKPKEQWQTQWYNCNTEVEQFVPALIKEAAGNIQQ